MHYNILNFHEITQLQDRIRKTREKLKTNAEQKTPIFSQYYSFNHSLNPGVYSAIKLHNYRPRYFIG